MWHKILALVDQLLGRKDKAMARPRVIELENGTVSLSGFPVPVANQLTAYLKKFEFKAEPEVAPVNPMQQIVGDVVGGAVVLGAEHGVEFKAPELSKAAVEIAVEVAKKNTNLTDQAAAVKFDPATNKFNVLIVHYDPKSDVVENVLSTEFKRDAVMKFKQVVDQLKFI